MPRRPSVSGTTFGLRSVRGRSILAGLALLLLLAGVAAVALWRAQSEQSARKSLEQRALTLSALDIARSDVFLTAVYVANAALVDDPTPFVDQFHQSGQAIIKAIQDAQDELAAAAEPDDVASLDAVTGEVETLLRDVEPAIASFLTSSREERVATAQQIQAQLWPPAAGVIAELERLAQEQEAKLASERAAAGRTSETTVVLFDHVQRVCLPDGVCGAFHALSLGRTPARRATREHQSSHIGQP